MTVTCNDPGHEAGRRLEYLRGEIEAERISYGEIAELQGLAEHIDPSDVVLREWAGIPEFAEPCIICGAYVLDGEGHDDGCMGLA